MLENYSLVCRCTMSKSVNEEEEKWETSGKSSDKYEWRIQLLVASTLTRNKTNCHEHGQWYRIPSVTARGHNASRRKTREHGNTRVLSLRMFFYAKMSVKLWYITNKFISFTYLAHIISILQKDGSNLGNYTQGELDVRWLGVHNGQRLDC